MPNTRRDDLLLVLHLFLLLSELAPFSARGDKVSCEIPSVESKTETNLTCFFSKDVRQTKNDVTVYHYSNVCGYVERPARTLTGFPNVLDQDRGRPDVQVVRTVKDRQDTLPNAVLDCLWINGKMLCLHQPGYEFDQVVTDRLTVRIPRASNNHTGRYTCQMSGQQTEDIQSCYFDLQRDETVSCDIPAAEPTTATQLTCHFPEDLNQTRRNFMVYHYMDSGKQGTVLDCSWRRHKLHCDISHGYEFDKVVTDKVTVRLPYAFDDHLGKYTCQLLGTTPNGIHPCYFAFSRDETVTCEIPSVERGTDTQLTCHFPEDVTQSQRNFMVYHHRDQTRRHAGTVVECRWLDGATDCSVQHGYVHDKVVSNKIILRIPRAFENHTGNYTCQLLGTKPQGVQPCHFTLKQGSEVHVTGRGRLTTKGVSGAVSGVILLAIIIIR